MIRENGSRRTCRTSFATTARRRLTGPPRAGAASAASTWWMNTSSSDGRIRSIEVAGFDAAASARSTVSRPSSASRTTTWIRVPKTEVSSAQGCAPIASRASPTRDAVTSSTAFPAKTRFSSETVPRATRRPAWMRARRWQYSASSR